MVRDLALAPLRLVASNVPQREYAGHAGTAKESAAGGVHGGVREARQSARALRTMQTYVVGWGLSFGLVASKRQAEG